MAFQRHHLCNPNGPGRARGTHRRDSVSNIEIWCECFFKDKEDLRPSDSYAITALMVRMPGWRKSKERVQLPIYGRQRVYVRDCE